VTSQVSKHHQRGRDPQTVQTSWANSANLKETKRLDRDYPVAGDSG